MLRIITGELASPEAAAQAGVDRSTIMASRTSAKDGAIAALQALRPGRRRDAREASELARLRAAFDWAGPPPVRPITWQPSCRLGSGLAGAAVIVTSPRLSG